MPQAVPVSTGRRFFRWSSSARSPRGNQFSGQQRRKSGFSVLSHKNGLTWLFSYATRMRGYGDHATELVTTRCKSSGRLRIYQRLAADLGFALSPLAGEQQVHQALQNHALKGIRLVWLLDRCHVSVLKVADELTDRHENLSVVVGMMPGNVHHTGAAFGRQSMQIDLVPLELSDAGQFLRFGLERAGQTEALFSDNAVVRLYELTEGIIGRFAFAAESSLALAAGMRLARITPGVVEAVEEQLRAAA